MNYEYQKRLSLGSPLATPCCSPVKPPSQSHGDRFVPCRTDVEWEIRFRKSCRLPKSKRRNSDTFTRMYPYVLENELLGSAIENVSRRGVATGSNSLPIPRRNLFTYSVPANEVKPLVPIMSPISPASNKLLAFRVKSKQIQTSPFKVLDAPDLSDDFYLNLLDWSAKDILSVGLAGSVYTFAARTSQVSKLFDLATGDTVTSVSWEARGDLLAVGTHEGHVDVWDAEKGVVVTRLEGHTARVGSMAWKGHVVATGSQDRLILLRDVRVPAGSLPQHTLKRHRQEVCGLRWAPGFLHLASGGNDNRLYIWDLRSSVPLQTYTEHNAAVKAMAWSPHQQNLLATGSGTADRCIRFYNILLGRLMLCQDTGSQVCNLAWSKTSSQLVTTHGYSQNQIIVWQYPTLIREAELKGHSSRVVYLAVSPDGGMIVTGAGDETLRFWRVFTETRVGRDTKSALDLFENVR